MAPVKRTKRHLSSPEECTICLSLGHFLPLKVWVKMCAASGKPQVVLRAALAYLTTVERTASVVVKDSILICPHGKLGMWVEESRECCESANPAYRAWSKNVPAVYDMLKCFNVHTAHQIALEKADSLAYNGPLRMFKDEDFECLQDARHILQLVRTDHRAVESVVSTIVLIDWTSD